MLGKMNNIFSMLLLTIFVNLKLYNIVARIQESLYPRNTTSVQHKHNKTLKRILTPENNEDNVIFWHSLDSRRGLVPLHPKFITCN